MTHGYHLPLPDSDTRVRRLIAACSDGGAADVAPLLRQVLLASGTPGATCVIPTVECLVEEADAAGLEVEDFGADKMRIRLGPSPSMSWLEGDTRALDLAASAPGDLVTDHGTVSSASRLTEPVDADPAFTRATGYVTHPVAAQRDAARAIALAPPGAVTHVVLPTGSGKSEVGLLPALLGIGQVIVVVPTVAIALDQEESIRRRHGERLRLPDVLAWHAGLDQARRAGVRERLRAGTQRILVTSPEALVTGLEATVRDAAARGLIHTLTVDEAHLVHDWGLSFRPEFQDVASLRQWLVEAATAAHVDPPRTVLQTATLHEDALRLNDGLFPDGDHPRLAGAVALRTEPRYLRHRAANTDQARRRLAELLRVVPRPAIVYASRKRVVTEIVDMLRQEGFHRVAAFTGDTGDSDRRRILARWQGRTREPEIDVVVGTAAFGLGVDQQDVRTVVHAETPASVGSFYQEVGRGGRDGNACISVLITSPQDELQAPKIADHKLISNDKAVAYWRALRKSMSAGGVVDLGSVPAHLDDTNDKVQLWSRNTLVLMQWAGLIRVMPVPLPKSDASDEEWSRWGRSRLVRVVEVIRDEDLPRRLDVARTRIRGARRRDRDDVRRLHSSEDCYGTIFATAYALDAPDLRVGVTPAPACSGCPGCRRSAYTAADPLSPTVATQPDRDVPIRLRPWAKDRLLVVHDSPEWFIRYGRDLVQRLVAAGVRHVFLDHPDRRVDTWLAGGDSPYVAIDAEPGPLRPFVRPSLVYLPRDVNAGWRTSGGGFRVIVIPTGTPAPDRRDEPIDTWWQPSVLATRLMEGI